MKYKWLDEQIKPKEEYLSEPTKCTYVLGAFEQNENYKKIIHDQYNVIKKQGLSKINEKDLDRLYLCHVTSFFPQEGVIIPRKSYQLSLFEKYKILEEVVIKAFSTLRPTIHFSINSIAESHKEHGGFDKNSFVILDKIQHAKRHIVGGYIEDLFVIGAYQLSSEATILVPKHYKENPLIQSKIRTLPEGVKISYYDKGIQEAVREWLKVNKAPYLETKGIADDPDVAVFVGRLGQKYVESAELMKFLGKKFCGHDITPMSRTEILLQSSVLMKPPYLEVLATLSLEETVRLLGQLKQVMLNVFNLNADQKSFLNAYEQTLIKIVTLFSKSPTLKELEKNWEMESELIMNYDAKVNLSKPISYHTLSLNLSRATGLNFKPYFRTNCQTIVDAACSVSSGNVGNYVDQLNKTFGNYFSHQSYGKNHYILVRQINERSVSVPLDAQLNQGKKITFSESKAISL